MIVVDSNVVAYLYLPGNHTAKAEALLERDPDWAAPVLWRSEFRNTLAGYLRRGTPAFAQDCGLQCEAEDLLAGSEFELDSEALLELVRDSDCSEYVCELAALAMKLQTKLFTLDAKLLKAFPKRAVPLAAANV